MVTDGESQPLRRTFYEAWATRASDRGPSAGRFDNGETMQQILRLRHEAAQLLDFKSYAEYALANRMAHTVPEVMDFLHELVLAARPAGANELAELERFAGRKLEPWDIGYFSERLQHSRFSISQEELRTYLPLPRVLAGLFEVAERLFGVRIRERTDVALWDSSARYSMCKAPTEHRSPASILMLMHARTSAAVPGWMTVSVVRLWGAVPYCQWPIWSAISCRPARAAPRC